MMETNSDRVALLGNNSQYSKYITPAMIAVIALLAIVVAALTATVATSINSATYGRCIQDTSNCPHNNGSCSTPSFNYDTVVS